MDCLTCTHWDAKRTAPEIRRIGLAVCALGPRWQYLPPESGCARFTEAPAETAAARRQWKERRDGSHEP